MIRVDYAGPGGVCEGFRRIGVRDIVGIEWDASACATRAAAGHHTIRADLATYRPHHPAGTVTGYWGSPPCPTFSLAGGGEGRAEIDRLAEVISRQRWADADLFDDRTRHVVDAARTAVELHPEWVGMEQVTTALPLFKVIAHLLAQHGYSTWAGELNAADYGVPQTRRRAILMASRARTIQPPEPTHAERPEPTLFGDSLRPWVSMSEALGMAPDANWVLDRRQITDGPNGTRRPVPNVEANRPAPTLTAMAGAKGVWVFREIQSNGAVRRATEPSMTISASADNGDFRLEFPEGTQRLTLEIALAFQSFPKNYPLQGSIAKKFEQVGNAVPPLLASHIGAALTGITPQTLKAA